MKETAFSTWSNDKIHGRLFSYAQFVDAHCLKRHFFSYKKVKRKWCHDRTIWKSVPCIEKNITWYHFHQIIEIMVYILTVNGRKVVIITNKLSLLGRKDSWRRPVSKMAETLWVYKPRQACLFKKTRYEVWLVKWPNPLEVNKQDEQAGPQWPKRCEYNNQDVNASPKWRRPVSIMAETFGV